MRELGIVSALLVGMIFSEGQANSNEFDTSIRTVVHKRVRAALVENKSLDNLDDRGPIEQALDFLDDIELFKLFLPGVKSSFDSEFNFFSVIGQDTRVRVSNTTRGAWATFGRLSKGCSGTLVGPRHVLTAGHCVFKNGKFKEDQYFSPGRNEENFPFGIFEWEYLVTTTGWTESYKLEYDFALVILSKPIGQKLGYIPMARAPLNSEGLNIQITGYPGDKPRGSMWFSRCKSAVNYGQVLGYDCDTAPGMSGSSVIDLDRGKIVAVHGYGQNDDGYNRAVLFNPEVWRFYSAWSSNF